MVFFYISRYLRYGRTYFKEKDKFRTMQQSPPFPSFSPSEPHQRELEGALFLKKQDSGDCTTEATPIIYQKKREVESANTLTGGLLSFSILYYFFDTDLTTFAAVYLRKHINTLYHALSVLWRIGTKKQKRKGFFEMNLSLL